MAEIIACLTRGRVVVLQAGDAQRELHSPYVEQLAARTPPIVARFVDVSRGRRSDELCYAVSSGSLSSVFTQIPGSGEERRLFAAEAEIRDLDFSFADEALACTVRGKEGTSAIGLLADDGRGMRTVTEGDVLDREPRWAPGGRGEIVYASAGVGRTKSGAWVALSPFSLHRLKLADSTVEVLVSDAKYDYLAPVPVSDSLIYAIRRAHAAKPAKSALGVLAEGLLAPFRKSDSKPPQAEQLLISGSLVDVAQSAAPSADASAGYELVRITEKRIEAVAPRVLAFDVSAAGVIAYSTGSAVFRLAAEARGTPEHVADLEHVEQVVIC
jgi:hypothetical protein